MSTFQVSLNGTVYILGDGHCLDLSRKGSCTCGIGSTLYSGIYCQHFQAALTHDDKYTYKQILEVGFVQRKCPARINIVRAGLAYLHYHYHYHYPHPHWHLQP